MVRRSWCRLLIESLVLAVVALWVPWDRMWAFANSLPARFSLALTSTLYPSHAPTEPVSALDCRTFFRANGDSRPFVVPEKDQENARKARRAKDKDTEDDVEEEHQDKVETQEQDHGLIKVVSYNILAPCYTSWRLARYPYTSGSHIDWAYRMPRVVRELQLLDGDMVGLQEVDEDYWEEFNEKVKGLGYESIFLKKTDPKRDGVAVLYKPEKFTLRKLKEVILDDLALEDSPTAEDVGLLQHQVAIIAAFATQDGRLFIFSNIHVYFLWLRPDVQAVQAGTLMHEIEKFRQELLTEMQEETSNGSSSERKDTIPLILCGDFNAVPYSLPHLLISTRNIADSSAARDVLSTHPVFANLSSSDSDSSTSDRTENPFLHRLKHNVQVESAYKQTLGKELPLTNFGADFQGTLDYIWVSPDLEVEEVLDVVPEQTRKLHYGCPNAQFPSDHFSLLASVRLPH